MSPPAYTHMYIWWDTKPEFIVRDDRDYGERWSQKDGFLWSVAMLFWWMDRDVRRDAGRGAHVREPRLLLILFVECHNIWQRPFRTRHLSSQRTTKVFFSLDRLQFSGRLIRQSVNKNHVLNEMRPRIPRPLFLKRPPLIAISFELLGWIIDSVDLTSLPLFSPAFLPGFHSYSPTSSWRRGMA